MLVCVYVCVCWCVTYRCSPFGGRGFGDVVVGAVACWSVDVGGGGVGDGVGVGVGVCGGVWDGAGVVIGAGGGSGG